MGALSLFGALIWDRLCHYLFAPDIFAVMRHNVMTTTFTDFWPVVKTVGMVGGGMFLLSTGNIMGLGAIYMLYRNWNQQKVEIEKAKVERAAAPASGKKAKKS